MGGVNGTEAEKRLHRCCFTGHRPEKLNCTEKEAVALLTDQIRKAYSLGYTTFISGMARGIDIWAAEIVLAEKIIHPDIRLICALPHPDFEKRWSAAWQHRYSTILQKADLIKQSAHLSPWVPIRKGTSGWLITVPWCWPSSMENLAVQPTPSAMLRNMLCASSI